VTLEQAPPKSLFTSNDGSSFINNGTTTYACSKDSSSGTTSCVSYPEAQNPMASLLTLYSPTAAEALFQTAESEVAAKLAGISINFTSQTFAGQPSTCVTYSYAGSNAKYCVTKSGVLAYEGGGSSGNSSAFELTAYSTSVSASDFALPTGATVETMPSIP
jgi:hypothetical protein